MLTKRKRVAEEDYERVCVCICSDRERERLRETWIANQTGS